MRRQMEGNDEPKELIKAVIAMADEVVPVEEDGVAVAVGVARRVVCRRAARADRGRR